MSSSASSRQPSVASPASGASRSSNASPPSGSHPDPDSGPRPLPAGFFKRNGLTLALLAGFLAIYSFGQLLTGLSVFNEERAEHGEPPLSLGAYLGSAHFAEASAENWESEFLQMFIYVWMTSFLFQKGSAESKDPDAPEEPPRPVTPYSPWPVRRGGWWRRLYAHSLSLSLAGLFAISFWLHLLASTRLENIERARRGEPAQTVWEGLAGAQFWFESFQNWQSEFLAILAMVVLSIFLREKGSPESKAPEAPHHESGG